MTFINISTIFGSCTISLAKIVQQKYALVKKIHNQIHKLLVTLTMRFSDESNIQHSKFGLIQAIAIQQLFTKKQISFLKRFSTKKQCLLNYQDMCQYLCVNSSISSKYFQYQIQNEDVQVFVSIVRQQQKTLQTLITEVNEVVPGSIQNLFDQIDFFNNGYIDMASMTQFLSHYLKQSNQFQLSTKKTLGPQKHSQDKANLKLTNYLQVSFDDKKGIQLLLRYMRASLKGQKVFLIDFINFFKTDQEELFYNQTDSIIKQHIGNTKVSVLYEDTKNNQHLIACKKSQNQTVGRKNAETLKNSIEGKKHNDSPIKVIQDFKIKSQFQLDQRDFKKKLTITANLPIHSDRFKINRSQLSVSLQSKMIQTFKRNEAYIKQIKTKQQFVPHHYKWKKQLHFDYKNKPCEWQREKEQFILSIKVLAHQIFTKMSLLLQLFKQSSKFTLLNAFNVIDQKQQSKVLFGQFKSFLSDCGIQKSQLKVINFFNTYSVIQQHSNGRVMNFSSFCKLFKLKYLKKQIIQLKHRRPLIYESWGKKMKVQYCNFIRNIIDVEYNIQKAKNQSKTLYQKIKQKDYQMEEIFQKQIIKTGDIVSILGKDSQSLAEEITNQRFFSLKLLQKFIL